MNPIRILMADDHPLLRTGLRALLSGEPDLLLVGEAENGREALRLVRETHPDLLLLDMHMPEMDGLGVLSEAKGLLPGLRILVLTSFSDEDLVFPAIKSGADGYLLKNTAPNTLLQAIRAVARGEPSMSPSIAAQLMRELQRPPDLPPTEDPLTQREVDVLRLIAQGLSNSEIAGQLFIAEGTVRLHASSILGKLHLANRTQAALYALREGLAKL